MPTAQIICIGDEILAGRTVNTNASYLSQKLLALGFTVSEHHVIPDDEQQMLKLLDSYLYSNDITLVTGGLGPTLDDLTKGVAAKLHQCQCSRSDVVASSLQERFGKDLPTLENQSSIPSNATPLLNSVGTAPGLLFEKKSRLSFFLPGVPSELHAIFEDHLENILKTRFPETEALYSKSLLFCQMREHIIDQKLRELKELLPSFQYGIYPSAGLVGVTISGNTPVDEPIEMLSSFFDTNCWIKLNGRLDEFLHSTLVEKQLTLACAESCSGGALSQSFTKQPGASAYFLGSVVSYSNQAKSQFLGVEPHLLEEIGAVSEEVAKSMARGASNRFGADYALSLTGIAGPTGGTQEKPVGTVHLAIAHKGKDLYHEELHLHGPRQVVIDASVHTALFRLLHHLLAT